MAHDEDNKPSEKTLDRTVERNLKFLGAISKNPVIYAILHKAGLTKEELNQGWNLALTAAGRPKLIPTDPSSTPTASEEAISELDQWDEPNFRRIKAILRGEFSDTLEYLFRNGLEAKQGGEAVASVNTLLERVETLQKGTDPNRKDKQAQDQAALSKLSSRGYTAQEWDRLRALVKTATTPEPPEALTLIPLVDPKEIAAARLANYYWYQEWALTARQKIKRRDYLIQLGLVQRARPKKSEEEEEEITEDEELA